MTPLQALSVDDILNQAHLRRWHQIKMQREQTLAEHQYLVAMLAAKILTDCGAMMHHIDAVVSYALLHDAHEPEMVGDIASNPLPRKRANEQAGYDVSDAMQEDFWRSRTGQPLHASGPAVHLLVKLCDKMEALFHYILNGDPRTYPHRRIPEGLFDAVFKAVDKLDEACCRELHIAHIDLHEWVRQEMLRWVPRVGTTCGPRTQQHMSAYLNSIGVGVAA